MSEAVENLAENLKTIRTKMGLTQADLAKLCGVPRSTIANIETGVSNPTLSVLTRLSDSLRVGIEELLSRSRGGIQHFKADTLETVQRGKGRIKKLLPHPIPGMEIDRVELPPGARVVGVPHRQGTQEYLCCEAGQLVLWTAGERVVVEAGDVVAFPGDQKHSYLNEGDALAVAFSVVTMIPAAYR